MGWDKIEFIDEGVILGVDVMMIQICRISISAA
jgi:hypothetical protein